MTRRVHIGIVIVVVLAALSFPSLVPAAPKREARAQQRQEQPVIGPATGDDLHVMTFNLRFASDREPHSWRVRRPVVGALLRRELPTVLGTQEGLYGQLRDLAAELPERYDWIGLGRRGGSRDEFGAVFFDTGRVTPLEFDHFWLSDTPALAGSATWGNRIPRMVTWVRFADRRTGGEFVVVNTHLDHMSENARTRSAQLLRDRIAAFPPELPVLLLGDFNAVAGESATYDLLTASLGDAWTAARNRRTPAYATWHNYGPLREDGPRIDWILTRGAVTVHAAAVNPFAEGDQYPSDHLPVQALVSLG